MLAHAGWGRSGGMQPEVHVSDSRRGAASCRTAVLSTGACASWPMHFGRRGAGMNSNGRNTAGCLGFCGWGTIVVLRACCLVAAWLCLLALQRNPLAALWGWAFKIVFCSCCSMGCFNVDAERSPGSVLGTSD
jgi:hypothetical protein